MNKVTLAVAAIALSMTSFAGTALAQTTPTPAFATVDADKSGEVSYSELQLVLPNYDQSQFNTADADKSGGLNETEFASIVAGGTGSLTTSTPKSDNTMTTTPKSN